MCTEILSLTCSNPVLRILPSQDVVKLPAYYGMVLTLDLLTKSNKVCFEIQTLRAGNVSPSKIIVMRSEIV